MKANLFYPLKERLSHIFDEYRTKLGSSVRYKEDNTPVTEVDIRFSKEIKEFFKKTAYANYTFYSEEDYQELTFPGIIVDPIDGTRELSRQIPECAVSVAVMESSKLNHPKNLYWLYNPFTGEEIRPDLRMPAIPSRRKLLKGYVSQTEWDEAYFLKEESRAEITLKPVGSIAYKLMLLALGKCDFVVTKKDKCIWDIAGGSTLL